MRGSYSIFTDNVLEKVVRYILSESKRETVLYGARIVKTSKTEIIEFPSLARKRARVEIWNGYRELVQDDIILQIMTIQF